MRKTWIGLLAVVALSLAIVPQSSYAEQEPGISKDVILLGTSYSQTGTTSGYYSSYFAGAQAYFSYLNSQGGIYGRKINLVTFDDQGVVPRAAQGVRQLIVDDKVFALFSAANSTASHKLAASMAAIVQRGVPDVFPILSSSGFRDSKKYPTTFVLAPSAQQEARVIASFIKDEFPNLGFNATVPNDDLGFEVKSAWESIGFSVSKYTSTSLPDGPIPKVDEKTGGILFTSRIKNSSDRFQSSSPFIARSEAVSSINRLIDIPKANWANTYAGLYLPLPSDANDEFVIFFNKIFSTYIPGQIIDAKTIEGANAAYVFAQALTAVGPQITRQKLIDFLRAKGNTLSHAGYTPLNFGADLTANKASLYFAKFDGVTWSRYSRSYSTELYSSLVSKESPIRSRLLPNGLPVANTNSNPATTTISCVKGKLVKSVTAIKPVCPVGYKKK